MHPLLCRPTPCLLGLPALMHVLTASLAALACMPLAAQQTQRVEITGQLERRSNALPLNQATASGSRLGLTVQETPAAIDVITSELMQERGNRTTQDALENAAGIVSGQCYGLTCASLRGFSGPLSLPFLFDGLRYPGLAFSPRGSFVYDRIEVIKGPSSVLHGLGSVTGAVNFVTKAADGRKDRQLFLSYDRWQARNFGLGLGGAVSPDLAYRFDINLIDAARGSAGWVDRTAYRYLHAAGELAWRITPALKFTLSAQALDDDGEWYFGTPLVNGRLDKRVRDKNYNVDDSLMHKRADWLRANVEYSFSPQLGLRNETYRNDEKRRYRNAEVYSYNAGTQRVDLGDLLHIVHDQALLGNRTEVTAEHAFFGLRNRMVAGLDLSRNEHQRTNNAPYAAPALSVDFLNPVPVAFNTTSAFTPQRRTELAQQAFFVENLLSLTPAFKLSLSARHDRIDLDSFDLRANTSFDRQWRASSWRLGALYDISPALTAYAQASRAYEPPAQVVTLTAAQRNYALTRARQVEIGVKGQLPAHSGEFTLAVFDITRSNMLTRDPANPGLTVQIGEQSSRGMEFDLAWRLTPQWSLGVNGSWLKAQFDHFNESVGGVAVSRAGLLPPDTPERVANVFLTWKPADAWRLNASLRRVGARTADNANTVVMPAYTTLNLGASWRLAQGELGLRVRNATDEVYLQRSYGATQALLGEPRAVEISYALHF